jgi:CheY-like chemotaxis protein
MTSATLLQSTVPANNISVLVVDDEEPLRNLLQISLQRQGYHVAVARNGREALEIVAERKIDLVLLDIMMPELDGFGYLHRVAQAERHPNRDADRPQPAG